MNVSDSDTEMLKLLAARLERLSADCTWAHRGSGIRGQVLRALDRLERGEAASELDLARLSEMAFKVLEEAAREIR
ncbi:MAG: hypothetical protein ACM3QS_01935 [Bacteroidota bacterium]